ncbi:putative ribonuclease H-like domain-containing protein [Tanacetum coccineum]
MSMMFLLKNFKIVEQDVKKSVGASSGAQNLAFMTAPSTSSTNDVNTANLAYEVSTVSPNVNTACPQVSTANFSDNTMFAFRVENPNGSNLLQQDIEQIQEDDLEKNGFEVADLSAKYEGKKVLSYRTGKKIFINSNDTARYDKSKVECFNCHKMGHFARECRAPRNKEGQFRYQDNTRKQGNNEDTSLKAMLAINSVGFDWSDMAGEQVQTNMALMAFSNSEGKLRKEGIEFKIEKFDNASKSLDKLLGSQITEKSKKDLGYDTVPLPHPLIYNGPTKLDLSYSGLDEFKDPKFKSYGSKDKQVLEDTSSFVKSPLNVDKETVFLVDKKIEFVKPKNLEKPVKRFDNKSLDTAMRHYLLERPEQLISARSDNGTEFKNKVMDDFCREKGIKREYSVARTPQQNGMAERRNMTLIKAARTMLADSKLPTTFWAKAVSTACYVQYRPFGCHVIILNTLDNLGKFDSKKYEGSLLDIPCSSKAFRGTILMNLHVLQREPMEGTLFERRKSSISFVMQFGKSYFDSPSKDVGKGKPKSAADDQKQVKDGPHNESDEKDKSEDDSSPKEVNAAGQHVNTTNSPKDMFKLGASHTLEATNVEFFSDEDEPEVDLGNITNSYTVWKLVDLPNGKRAIGTKWVFRNKKDERGIVIRNKARLVAQGHRQEEGIYYEEVFAPMARIEAIRLFLAYASFMGFLVYQMDVKSAFLYGTIEEEVYVTHWERIIPRQKTHQAQRTKYEH